MQILHRNLSLKKRKGMDCGLEGVKGAGFRWGGISVSTMITKTRRCPILTIDVINTIIMIFPTHFCGV